MKNEINLIKPSQTQLKDIFKTMVDDEVFFNPVDMQIGILENIEPLDRMNKDKQAYVQIQINVRSSDNKILHKRYSVDFTRKFFTQIGKKASDLEKCCVVFKATGRFNSIGFLAFVGYSEETGYSIHAYEDEMPNHSERLSKLGL